MLAEQNYSAEEGARSLAHGVTMLEKELIEQYLSVDDLITEATNSGPMQDFLIKQIHVGNGAHEIGVYLNHAGQHTEQSDENGEGFEFEKMTASKIWGNVCGGF